MSNEVFERQLIKTIRTLMSEYNRCSDDEKLAEIARIELSSMGNFTDPETNKEYGYKFIIGKPDFHEESQEDEDFDDEDF